MKNIFTKEQVDNLLNTWKNMSLRKKIQIKKESEQWAKDNPEHVLRKLSASQKRKARKESKCYGY